LILEKRTSCWNTVIWIHLYYISIRSSALTKTGVTVFAPTIFILRGRNINRKTLITQIWIIRPRPKLNIIMFSIAVDAHHALTIFVWILSVTWASNGYGVILFLVKVWNVHLGIFTLINRLSSIISTLGSRSTQRLILTDSKRIWNYLNGLLGSLVIGSVHLAWLALIGVGWDLAVVQELFYLTFV